MKQHMLLSICILAEFLLADVALIWLLAGVNSLMPLQIGCLREALVAAAADVRPVIRVRLHVLPEASLSGEGFETFITKVRHHVDLPMLLHFLRGSKALQRQTEK